MLAHGVFDLLHMGHARHPNGARTHGDFLFVTLTADAFVTKGPGKSVFSENLRAEMLAALSMVDYVAINHAPDAEDLLQRLRPDVYAKGSDYRDAEADVAGKINREREAGFTTLTLRPATVCGYSQRLRRDLTVNILTNHAINNGRIRVFGGSQRQPNIHIVDMTDLYVKYLFLPAEKIDGGIYNAGYEKFRPRDCCDSARKTNSCTRPAAQIMPGCGTALPSRISWREFKRPRRLLISAPVNAYRYRFRQHDRLLRSNFS